MADLSLNVWHFYVGLRNGPVSDIVRKDRITNGRNGGGVCIYVRDNLNYIIRDDLSPDGL